MRIIYLGAAGAVFALAGCASLTPSTWSKDVSLAQNAWTAVIPVINVAVAAKAPSAAAAVTKAENTVTADLVALAAAPAPTSATALITDLQAVEAALPPGTLSSEDQALVSGVLSLAQVLAADA